MWLTPPRKVYFYIFIQISTFFYFLSLKSVQINIWLGFFWWLFLCLLGFIFQEDTGTNTLQCDIATFCRIYLCLIFRTEKAMAPHSSTLAWKVPWMEEHGRLQSMGSLRVTHDWATSLLLFTFMHWRRKWQPTPVLLPGESQGQGSLVGCHLWGRTESDTTEVT